MVGSRHFFDFDKVEKVLNILQAKIGFDVIVSGGANGADSLGVKYALKYNIEFDVYIPDWNIGKGAGYIRNVEIWDNSDYGIAFWDGESKGTEHSFKLAKKQGKRLYVYNYMTNETTII